MLTKQQKKLFDFLVVTAKSGTPSYREMQKGMGLASISGVHRLVKALEERGYVKRIANRARCIEIAKVPNSDDQHIEVAASVACIAASGFRDAQAYRDAISAIHRLASANSVELS